MKSLNIKYLYAQNFLCFGPDAFELDLTECGNIVLVKGHNMDVSDETRTASNGSGKSSIPEILVYTLFGKTIKHPKKIGHKDVVNNQTGSGLKTEVRWGDFRVVRARKPEALRFWESKDGVWDDSTEITLGGMPATQKLIEEKLGLNYETFVNVVVFTDNNAGSFLECDAANKREIVENLLSLEKYNNFSERAKNLKKEKKDEIKIAQTQYESARQGLQQAQSRMKAAVEQESIWKEKRKSELKSLSERLESLEKQLSSSPEGEDSSRYQKAQERIEELNSSIGKFESKQIKIQGMLDEATEKSASARDKRSKLQTELNEVFSSIKSISAKISEHKKEIGRLEDSDGATCKFCMGTISKDNFGKYTDKMSEEIEKLSLELGKDESKKDSLNSSVESAKARENSIVEAAVSAKKKLSEISSELSSMRKELSELNKIEKPKSKDVTQQLVEQQISGVKEQISEKKKEISGESPFAKIIDSLDKEIKEKDSCFKQHESSLESLEKQLPYYEFWSVAFGDSGIRKFVIDGIIPALNSRIAYWMQFLIDGKIKLEFNNELEETIERNPPDGDPFVYYGMSGGEKRRLNLAVSQAFAHVMMLSSGSCPSIVFLDEVTTNIDQMGVVGVYNMIAELAKDRQVFVTTHDQNLLELLEGCELISLEKRKGFTHLKKQK